MSPKRMKSTAKSRLGDELRALFGRESSLVFPPPGPSPDSSFFAEAEPDPERARLYLGLGAQGRSMKVVLLRTYLALLSGGAKWRDRLAAQGDASAVDAYLTLLGYFNSLRELGGSRRIVEDEVATRLMAYGSRLRASETPEESDLGPRSIERPVMELTSRVSTDEVSEAKRRLGIESGAEGAVDVALASNMISVGLDITRLGLMVVLNQPKSTAEYIQATSRVGRGAAPGTGPTSSASRPSTGRSTAPSRRRA